jgi:type VI secretion system secreted protein VgrG
MASDPSSVVFELLVPGAPIPLEVVSFRGRERISRPYVFVIRLVGPEIDPASLEEAFAGREAHLRFGRVGEEERWTHGILRRIEAEGASGDRAGERHHYRAWLAPTLWLLGRGRYSRIFQDRSVPEIVRTVLRAAGVRLRVRLRGNYPPRVYCVQHEESDLAFVERLLAEEGIFYYFEQPTGEDEAEILVLADDAALCPPIGGSATLRFRDSGGMTEREADLRRFRLRRRVEPGSVLLKEFDFLRPSADLIDQADAADLPDPLVGGAPSLGDLQRRATEALGMSVDDVGRAASRAARAAERAASRAAERVARRAVGHAARAVTGALGASVEDLIEEPTGFVGPDGAQIYDHHGEHDGQSFTEGSARVHLEQARRKLWVGLGEGRCQRLLPGHTISVEGTAIAGHDRAYVLFEVEHEGHDPRHPAPEGGARPEIYRSAFQCVPAGTPFRPRRPPRRLQQVLETAVVVGPEGREIHCDAHGRIKVQFHWDRAGRRNEHASCWIRVLQPWAGAGWGVQFIPRVGMEVMVAFLGGDVDRPVILGSVYNAEHPPPFPLPAERTKSGIRTQSSRGGDGYNELSFEDRKGYERVFLRAEKDLDVQVEHNETRRITVNQVTTVNQNQYAVIGGNRLSTIAGNAVEAIGGNATQTVEGDRHAEVRGNRAEVLHRDGSLQVEGSLDTRVGGRERHTVGGAADLVIGGDYTLRVTGNHCVVVGAADARRASVQHTLGAAEYSSTGPLEIQSAEGIELRCGASVVRIGPESISVCSPSIGLYAGEARVLLAEDKAKIVARDEAVLQANALHLRGQGASVDLTDAAEVRGSQVRLGRGGSGSDSIEAPRRARKTKIELTDQDGRPLAGQRFVLRLESGEERVGVVDDQGKAELEIQGGGAATIVFPDVGALEAR